MAIESLFERGSLADWREFAVLARADSDLAARTLAIAERHTDRGSAMLAAVLIARWHPALGSFALRAAKGSPQAHTHPLI